MSSVVKLEFEKELEDLKKQLLLSNNGVIATAQLSNQNILIVKETIDKANATVSIDERIKLLATGLQAVVTHSEKYCAELKETILRLEDKIKYLAEFSLKIDQLVDENEKSNPTDNEETS